MQLEVARNLSKRKCKLVYNIYILLNCNTSMSHILTHLYKRHFCERSVAKPQIGLPVFSILVPNTTYV